MGGECGSVGGEYALLSEAGSVEFDSVESMYHHPRQSRWRGTLPARKCGVPLMEAEKVEVGEYLLPSERQSRWSSTRWRVCTTI